jgi:hypothetical protein
MTAHDNLACQWFERVWNQNDVAAMAVLTTPDVKAHGADCLPAPGGTPIAVSGLTLVRLEGNKIAEGWDEYDYAGLMRQLAVPV